MAVVILPVWVWFSGSYCQCECGAVGHTASVDMGSKLYCQCGCGAAHTASVDVMQWAVWVWCGR